MLLKNSSTFFLYSNRSNGFLKSRFTPLFNIKTVFFSQTRSTSTTVFSNVLNEASSKGYIKPYFLQYLLRNPIKYSMVDIDKIKLDDETNFKSLNLLKDVLNSNEEEITDLTACLRNEFKTYGLEEIYKYIILLSKYHRYPRLRSLIIELDKELLSRKFSDTELLKILSLCGVKLPSTIKRRHMFFSTRSFSKLCRRISKLTTEQIVQLFFCMSNLHPEVLKKVKFPIQHILSLKMSQFNAEELGIIAYGLTNNDISLNHADLLNDILFRVTEELDNISNEAFFKLCWLIMNNAQLRHVNSLHIFQENLIPHLPRFKTDTLSVIALLGAYTNYMHPSLWEALVDHLKKNIDNYALIEINRFVHGTTLYNIQDEKLLDLSIEQFEKKVDFVKDYKILISFLYSLVLHNRYPENLIHLIFSENFTTKFNPELFDCKIRRKYCFINSCIKLEKPTLNVKLIDPEKWAAMINVFNIEIYTNLELQKCRVSLYKIGKILEEIFGENTICESNCLPHYAHGIVMKFDKSLEAKTFTSNLENHSRAQKASNEHLSLFLTVTPTQQYLYESKTPTLRLQTQIKQLKALGYKPVLIGQRKWMEIFRQNNEREFLKNLIMKSLQEISEESQESKDIK